jgi:HEAT repeat protein
MPMTTSPDPANPLSRALKQLATATKVISFYPAQHPTVVSALDKAVVLLKEALSDMESLTVGVSEAAFLLDGAPLEEEDRGLAGFASYLSRRDLGALLFRPPIEAESLRGFLEVIGLDPGTLRGRGGPKKCLAERRLGGIAVMEFDASAALKSARTESGDAPTAGKPQPRLSWSDLLARYLAGKGPLPPGGQHLIRRVAGDPSAAWDLMTSLREIVASAGPERMALLTSALKSIAAEVAAHEPEAMGTLAQNLASSLMALDPASRRDLLGASIPVPGTDVDLGTAIRARIPEDKMGEIIVSLVQSEGNLNARLASVIRKVLIDRGVNEQDKIGLQEALRTARQSEPPPANVWDSVEDLLKESQDDWISREYKGLLEMIGEHAPPLEEALKNELMAIPDFIDALTPEGILRRTWLLFGDLVAIDQESARQWVALDQIEKRAVSLTPGWYADTPGVVESVRGLLATDPPPKTHVIDAVPHALAAVAEGLVRSYRRDFHKLKPEHLAALDKALEALGEHSIASLLDGLAQEEDWEVRRPFLALLAARGRVAVPALVRRLNDPSWYLVRNILLVLGEIADPATIPTIATTLKHPEPRVRRDAVAALGKIGGLRAFALLKDCLGDNEVYEVVMRSLATIDRRQTITTFLEMTEKADLFGRGHARLKDAVATLGALGSNEAVPRLRSILMRGFWLPPSAGDPLRIAAARALEKIGTDTARGALMQGARLWRWPVRAVCVEIVGQRSAGDDSSSVR